MGPTGASVAAAAALARWRAHPPPLPHQHAGRRHTTTVVRIHTTKYHLISGLALVQGSKKGRDEVRWLGSAVYPWTLALPPLHRRGGSADQSQKPKAVARNCSTAVRCHRRERVERRVCRPAGLAQCRRGVSLQRGEGGGSSARCRRGRERHTDRQRQRVSAAPAADWQRQ